MCGIRTNDRLGTDFHLSLAHEFCTNQLVCTRTHTHTNTNQTN